MQLDTPGPSPALAAYDVVRANDAREFDPRSLVSARFAGSTRAYKYRLREKELWRTQFDAPIFVLATRRAGPIVASYGANRFATEVSVEEADGELVGFTTLLRGAITYDQGGHMTTATGTRGLAFRHMAGTRLLTSDDSARTTVFFNARELAKALEHQLDERLHAPLAFHPEFDWSTGLATSFKAQLEFVVREFGRPNSIAGNPAALASVSDLLMSLALRGVPHNYSARLQPTRFGAVPACLRRAEDFMAENSTAPIRMRDVAAAAECSLRTLNAVFRQFRETTPLAVLHSIRLEQAYAALRLNQPGASVASVARQFGFANPSRFSIEFERRFDRRPKDVIRNGWRS